jgi:TolA-binding protein
MLISIFIASLALTGCSSLPWSNDEEDEDLFFEEDFGSEFDSESGDKPSADKDKKDEENFFNDDKVMAQSKPPAEPEPQSVPVSPDEEDFFFEDEPKAQPTPRPAPKPQPTKNIKQGSGVISEGGGFASVDQKTDKGEMSSDVTALRIQQEELTFRVQELQKIVNNLEPRLTATQERVDASLSAGPESPRVNAEIQVLKSEIIRLNSEIETLKKSPVVKKSPVSSRQTKVIKKNRPVRRYPKLSRTPRGYNKALAAYKSGKYDESILLFQELSLNNPPQNLKDNIVFWMGSNYLKLEMHDEAISQFQTVLTQYPDGNKVHDARYMLGVSYQKKGDTGRALDALEVALKSNPPAEVRQKIEKQLMEIK